MSTRITELAHQVYGSDITAQDLVFAELIVRECAKQVNSIYKQGGGTYGESILNHFGLRPDVTRSDFTSF
jgi:hypothetical protein